MTPPLRCTRCGATNDPFASVCAACGARNAFGQPAYEEPVSPPPTGRTRSPGSIARWGVAFAAVAVCARMLLLCLRAQSHSIIVQPITLPPFAPPTASTLSPAAAAKLPPARRFALTGDGRAVAFDGDHLKAHTSGGGVSEIADAKGPLAPRADSPLVVVSGAAYWIAAGDAEIASVRLLDWKPAAVVKGAHAIGALGADERSIWYTASDGKAQRKLLRLDVGSAKPAQLATWSSTRTNEVLLVMDADAFVVELLDAGSRIVRVAKSNGRATTVATLPEAEEVGALAASADAVYFTTGAPNEPARDLWRVPLAGGDRAKVLASPGAIGDIAVADKDVVIADRPGASWEVDSLPGGDVAQITIVASDVGRQPRRNASQTRIAWSTSEGISFSDSK